MNNLIAQAAATPLHDSNTRLIPLNPRKRGLFTIVDAADFEWLNRHKWHVAHSRSKWYVSRWAKLEDRAKGITSCCVRMHREIMSAPSGVFVDHIDGNPLNNTRANLRFATNAQNIVNTAPSSRNTSGFKGIIWTPRLGKWRAQIRVNRKALNLGCFALKEDAVRAYNEAAKKHYGEFARHQGTP